MADVIHRTTLKYLRSVHTPNYSPADWIINPDMSAVQGVDPKFWEIVGNSVKVMDEPTKKAKVLPVAKKQKIERFDFEINALIFQHYDDGSQKTLTILLIEAIAQGRYNRAAYIQKALDWVKGAIGYFYQQSAAVEAADSLDALDLVSWDLFPFAESDPKVTVYQVMLIPD